MRLKKKEVIERLLNEQVVALPTDTVYGLAAILSDNAMEALIKIKERPPEKPFVVQLPSVELIRPLLPKKVPGFEELAAAFWPGTLTVVLPIIAGCLPHYHEQAAFRVPAKPVLLEILEKTGPLAVPSANKSGQSAATCAEDVESAFGSDFPLLDDGPSTSSLPSSIVAYSEKDGQAQWKLLRKGVLSEKEIFSVLS